tara:strand:+ start:165 stop:275 length:111 start_codon:yes stop_codon:yes gene_type:complete
MEGLLHFASEWWFVLVAMGMIWMTDLIDWFFDKWVK